VLINSVTKMPRGSGRICCSVAERRAAAAYEYRNERWRGQMIRNGYDRLYRPPITVADGSKNSVLRTVLICLCYATAPLYVVISKKKAAGFIIHAVPICHT